MADARIAFDRGEYESALATTEDVLERHPAHGEAAFLAGRASVKLGKLEDAVEYFDRVPEDDESNYLPAQLAAGEILLFKLQKLSEAERRLRNALRVEPNNIKAHDLLAYLLGVTGRYRERVPHQLRVLRQNNIGLVHVLAVVLAGEVIENPEFAKQAHQRNPDDPLPWLPMARLAVEDNRHDAALALLKKMVKARPQLIAAHVALGRFYLEHNRHEDFRRWQANLPDAAKEDADIWALQGQYAVRQSQTRAAVRAYAEAVRRDPLHRAANHQLGILLNGHSKEKLAKRFLQRATKLQAYVNAAKAIRGTPSPQNLQRAAEFATALGLQWEARAWARLANRNGRLEWAAEILDQKVPGDSQPPNRRGRSENLLAGFDYHSYPLPQAMADIRMKKTPATIHGDGISFENRATASGVRFRYHNGLPTTKDGIKFMYAHSGGGVAVLDFDGDLRPDLCFSQGCNWPPRADQRTYFDRLYRNRGGGAFDDVTTNARFIGNGFGQGTTVGDYNADGLPDLFVANIGRNRLYRNNGDGTFTDTTAEANIVGEQWSTSCALADFNGDRLPDLYVVNYLKGANLFTRVCADNGRPVICHPSNFTAAQDRLFVNLGDGRFRDATAETGIVQPNGRGLGVVAADINGSGRLSVFVANDATANFLFTTSSAAKGGGFKFRDSAAGRGIALNGLGRAEACMGIAAGDADGDGRLDLFVTNLDRESNTLYLSQRYGGFIDATRRSGLHAASLPMVGFGTQFLDADRDGDLDLVVTNGHIDDFRHNGSLYRMPPQLFANDGKGRFSHPPPHGLGKYFAGKYLGRALARVDLNGDALDDCVVTHLDAPAALLMNRSKAGGYLVLHLRGVESPREAIGATVKVKTERHTIVRQLTAGDGYLASNERKLIIGLGTDRQIKKLTIRWPAGSESSFESLPVNSGWIVVEGAGRLFKTPDDDD